MTSFRILRDDPDFLIIISISIVVVVVVVIIIIISIIIIIMSLSYMGNLCGETQHLRKTIYLI